MLYILKIVNIAAINLQKYGLEVNCNDKSDDFANTLVEMLMENCFYDDDNPF